MCRGHIDFAQSVHERTRNVLWEIMLLPLQEPLLFRDASAPTMRELEEGLCALCRNLAVVLEHVRLQSIARWPDTVRVSTEQQLAALETNAMYFYLLARRGLSEQEPSQGLRLQMQRALALDWSHTELAAQLMGLLGRRVARAASA